MGSPVGCVSVVCVCMKLVQDLSVWSLADKVQSRELSDLISG